MILLMLVLVLLMMLVGLVMVLDFMMLLVFRVPLVRMRLRLSFRMWMLARLKVAARAICFRVKVKVKVVDVVRCCFLLFVALPCNIRSDVSGHLFLHLFQLSTQQMQPDSHVESEGELGTTLHC
jgi:hypothetical protein